MARKTKLTPKQQAFVREYLKDHNATAAYKRAGYKARSDAVAASSASELLRNPKVAEAIQAATQKVAERAEVDAARVLQELAASAFSDIGDVFDLTSALPRLLSLKAIPEQARRAVQSIKVRRVVEGTGDDKEVLEVTEIKLWDKLSALEKIGKHLGLWKDAARPDGDSVVRHSVEVLLRLPTDELLRLYRSALGPPPEGAGQPGAPGA